MIPVEPFEEAIEKYGINCEKPQVHGDANAYLRVFLPAMFDRLFEVAANGGFDENL